MPWIAYLAAVLVLTLILGALYAVLTALFFGLHENYRRHWQRAELQWTGPGSRALKQRPLPIRSILFVAFISAIAIIHLVFTELI